MDGAALDPQVDAADRHEAGELLRELLGFEDEIVTQSGLSISAILVNWPHGVQPKNNDTLWLGRVWRARWGAHGHSTQPADDGSLMDRKHHSGFAEN